MAVLLSSIYKRLKNEDDQQIKLITGEAGLNRTINWVHIVEINELTSFLEGNELVFTTGMALKSDEELLELIKKIYESGAGGIVINVGAYIMKIPQCVIDFCGERDLPLFEVPWQVYLGKTMKLCYEEINKADMRDLEITAAIQNAIFNEDNQKLYVPILEKHGFEQEWSYCVAIAEYEGKSEDLYKVVEKISRNIENSLVFYSAQAKAFALRNYIIILFVNRTDSDVYEIMENIRQRCILHGREDIKAYIGIGRNTKSVRCIYKSYRIAHKVVELQKKKHNYNTINSYRSMGFTKIFLAMDDTEIMQEYYKDVLEPLVRYDTLNNTDFTDFLRIYFECDASAKKTAERLFLHRNTVNYKIGKIQEILGCDLSDFYTKTELMIGLQLKELL